jgi:hypothetical protein
MTLAIRHGQVVHTSGQRPHKALIGHLSWKLRLIRTEMLGSVTTMLQS